MSTCRARTPTRHTRDATLQHLLLVGTVALPTVRYATASVGIAAAAALAVRSTSSATMAVFGGTVMLASMVLVALVTRLSTGRDPLLRQQLRAPAVALAWGVVCATIALLGLLISTTFWGVPNYKGQRSGAGGQGPGTCCPRQLLGSAALAHGVFRSPGAVSRLLAVQKRPGQRADRMGPRDSKSRREDRVWAHSLVVELDCTRGNQVVAAQ